MKRKRLPHEVIIFAKFHKDQTKIMDILQMANFCKCAVFSCSDFMIYKFAIYYLLFTSSRYMTHTDPSQVPWQPLKIQFVAEFAQIDDHHYIAETFV